MVQLGDDNRSYWARPFEKNKRLAIVLAFFAAFIVGNILFMTKIPGKVPMKSGTFTPNRIHDHTGKQGAVACDVPHCSQMGIEILRRGGNSADAAVTVALCIGSINFQSSGIGGGAFINVRDPEGKGIIIDARETAPGGAGKHMYDNNRELAAWGGLAAGVPGELRGLETMWKLFGSGNLTWHDLVHPVVQLNRKGFATSEAITHMVEYYSKNKDWKPMLKKFDTPGWEWFLPHGSNGPIPAILKRERFAATLEIIAKQGANAFYDPYGPIAPFLAEAAQDQGGILSAQDIADYRVVLRKPLNTTFMGRTVFTPPAPSSGPALIMGLNVIEKLLSKSSRDMHAVDTQRLIETMKWMAAARSELGDPAYVDNEKIDQILSEEWADNVRGNISDSHTLKSWRDYHPSYEMNEPSGTAHFSILDQDGMAVAITTTVNLPFGNVVCDPMTGIVLNSEMDDFSLPDTQNFFDLAPSIYNFIEAGKRPLSSMVPTIIIDENGTPETVIGAAGGSHIVTAVFQAIVRHYGYGIDLLGCIAYPRLHHQLIPEAVAAEFGIPDHVLYALNERGHDTDVEIAKTAMNGVFREKDGTMHAVSDFWRKFGEGAAH